MKIHKEVRQMPDKAINYMKTIDMIAAAFLFVGGINWGLVGLFNFDFVPFGILLINLVPEDMKPSPSKTTMLIREGE
jgi:hypothetical protein